MSSNLPEESTRISSLVARVRKGDAEAACELLETYEKEIRLEVRMRLLGTSLRQHLESMDICQSVFASFFIRVGLGQYTLDTSEDLIHLLTYLVKNKVIDETRRQNAARRDSRRTVSFDQVNERFPMAAPTSAAGDLVGNKDLLQEIRKRLTTGELAIVDRRLHGDSWEEIASELGISPRTASRRMQKAIDRVTQELDVDS